MDNQIQKELLEIIRKENIKDYKIKVDCCTNKGANLTGQLLAIDVTGSNNKSLHLICKSMPKDKAFCEMLRMDLMFNKERFVYKQLMPLYENFQKDKNILEKDRFQNYPKCYSFTDKNLIMKDLREDYSLSRDMDYQHAKLTLQTIAKFHALGLAIKHQMPEEFKKYCKDLGKDLFAKPVHKASYDFFNTTLQSAKEAINNDEEVLKEKLDAIIKTVQDLLPNVVDGANAEPYATFTHGNFRMDNMLFQYDKKQNPINICFLDFQICRYSSPATDISEFFFCCTNSEFRKKYYAALLQDYYESLSSFLIKLGSFPAKLFPLPVLHEHMKKFGVFGVIFASVELKLISEKDKSKDMENLFKVSKDDIKTDTVKKSVKDEDSSRLYKERMSNVLRDALCFEML